MEAAGYLQIETSACMCANGEGLSVCLSGVVNVVKTIGAVPWELTDVGFQVLCMDEDG